MAATVDLSQLMEMLKEMNALEPSGTASDLEAKLRKGRSAVVHIIGKLMSDMNKVSGSLERKGSSACDTVLQYIVHCVEHMPLLFIPPSPAGVNPSQINSQNIQDFKIEEKFCQAMIVWIISKLFGLLCCPSCSALYEKAENAIQSLLNLVKTKDAHGFHIIFSDLIACLGDSVVAYERYFDESLVDATWKVKQLGGQSDPLSYGDCHLRFDGLEIVDEESCELLQLSMTRVLTSLLGGCWCSTTQLYDTLWATLTCQLENGGVRLKQVSLAALCRLLSLHDLPSPLPLDYLISTLNAMFDFLASEKDVIQSVGVDLEDVFGQCYRAVLESDLCPTTPNHLQPPHLLSALEAVVSIVTSQGSQVFSPEFWTQLGHILGHLYARLSRDPGASVSVSSTRRRLAEALITQVGMVENGQYLVPSMYREVAYDLTRCSSNHRSGTCTRSYQSHHLAETLDARLTSLLEDCLRPVDLKASLHAKNLEGIRIITEIFVAMCHGKLSKASFDEPVQRLACGRVLSTDQVSALTACVKSLLGQSSALPGQVFMALYKAILEIIATLFCSDVTYLAPAATSYLVCVLSLPWMASDIAWMDLKPTESIEMANLANELSGKISDECKCISIQAVALLAKEHCPQWRKRLIQMAASSGIECLSRSVVDSFPLLLHNYGPNANHLVYDLLHGLINTDQESVRQSLAAICGNLSCVISRKVVLRASAELHSVNKIYADLTLTCGVCDLHEEEDDEKKFILKSVDAVMFSPFLQLMESRTNLQLAIGLKRVFNHIRTESASSIELWEKCLPLMEDPDYNVRVEFSKIMAFIVSSDENSQDADEAIMVKFQEAMVRAQQKRNIQLEETILLSIAELGKAAQDRTTSLVIMSLLGALIKSSPTIAAIVFDQIQTMSKSKYAETQTMFMEHRMAICRFVADVMHDIQSGRTSSRRKPLEALQIVTKVFEFSDLKNFLKASEPYLLPHLVTKATPIASQLIKLLAKEQNINYQGLLMRNTKFIFCYIVVQTEAPELDAALNYLVQETQAGLETLIRMHLQSIHNELTSYLSSNYSQVFHALKLLATRVDESETPTTTAEMADFLQPRLLGILASFDTQLLTNSIPKNEKQRALRSLISIISLMGTKHITSVRVKIMTTLKLGLRFKDTGFAEINCRAWKYFVRSVELTSLGPMLPQIIVALLPLLKQQPTQVAEIFHYLIVEREEQLHQHFHELYFLPEIPELSTVNVVLKKHSKTREDADLKTQIGCLLKGLSHEGLDVRMHAVSKMKRLLLDNQTALHGYILNNETSDDVITQLAGALLSGCRESDVKARGLFGECLGVLGAVDPGRMDLIVGCTSGTENFQSTVKDKDFAYNLINELARDFLAAEDTRTQDCTAFAIQQLLQIFEVTDSAENRLWVRFAEHVQEILTPLLTSRYICSLPDWSNLTKPIYMSRKGSTYKDWVCTWAGYLVSRLKDNLAKRVFQACAPVIKHSVHIAVYLLPYITAQTLFDNEEISAEICAEILAVLNSVGRIELQQGTVSDFKHLSAQTVFSVMDYLTRWSRHRVQILSNSQPGAPRDTSQSDPVYADDPQYRCVKVFREKIPQDLLAYASYNCKANTRAIMHFEQYMNQKKVNVQENLDFLQKLYAAVDEPDGVAGCTAIRQGQPSIHEQILAHESVGKLHDASACYERAVQENKNDVNLYKGMLSCMNDLGLLSSTLVHVNGLLRERPEWESDLNSVRVEACWQLGKWDDLTAAIKKESDICTWSVGLGKILLAGKEKDAAEFLRQLELVRCEQMGPLSAASMEAGSYKRGYEYIVRLHILNEVEESLSMMMFTDAEPDGKDAIEKLMTLWNQRISYVQASVRMLQPILTVRRAVMAILSENYNLTQYMGRSYLHSAKVARKAGHLQTAYSFLLGAADYDLPEVFVEKAKWLWQKNDNDVAISLLEKGIETHYSGLEKVNCATSDAAHLQCAKAMSLLARYSEETASVETNQVMKLYRDVIQMAPDLEAGYFYMAKYYDKLMTTIVDSSNRQGQFIMHVVTNFGKSLQFGNVYIYQSMPRMLSLWLDYGARVVEDEQKEREQKQKAKPTALGQQQSARNVLASLNKYVSEFIDRLPEYQFLTALPQLISRICHADQDVFTQLMGIICKVMVAYPQQTMWLMVAVSKSSYPMRVQRCLEIFSQAKQQDRTLVKFLGDATKLVDQLLDLCNRDVKRQQDSLSISQHFKVLKRLVDNRSGSGFSDILLPLQSLMTVTLPTGHSGNHNAFPGQQVYLQGFDDTVVVLNSLQKPKKFTMIGTDGKRYVMMCKPKDDLRKDCRLMEFNGIVNRCLRKDPEARKRQLYIRTYAVIPLNEECGVIEWVPNTSGFRHIISKMYQERRILMTPKEMKTVAPAHGASTDTKLLIFKTKLLPRHPPVFKEWFLRMFPDPTSWYMAHLSYSRTTAVMSMIGYILGLGDRHGENILFDSTNGDCVHVDFNCLFNRGETFEWPELVPFRLTHNMVDAMGPMGHEGIFRRACEVTMRVVRNEKDPLMSVLKTFIYDPLCEWSKSTRGPPAADHRIKADSGEIKNEMAQTHVRKIEHRISGILRASRAHGLPLSVEGHVNNLINEATNVNNLCRMYVGWTAFI